MIDNYIIDDDIKEVLEVIKNNEPIVYVAGKAGTGKSLFIEYLSEQTSKHHVVLAPTGVAALNVGGQTIHSFFRFPPKIINLSKDIRDRHDELINRLELIVVDEISMVRADVVNAMDKALKLWKRSNKPFGGVQMLFIGDCFQLSPVVTSSERLIFDNNFKSPWFFDANVFDDLKMYTKEFKTIYRQSDAKFIEILNKIREGKDLKKSIDFLNENCYIKGKKSKIILTTTNVNAASVNDSMLDNIDEEEHDYYGYVSGKLNIFGDNLPVPEKLTLKNRARVMIRKNIEGAVNGSLGYIQECFSDYVVVKLDNGNTIEVNPETWQTYKYDFDNKTKEIITKEKGSYTQIPIILGWAITIHRSQSLTLEHVKLHFGSGAFSCGQTYTALSRCKNIETLSFKQPIKELDVMVDSRVVEFYEEMEKDGR